MASNNYAEVITDSTEAQRVLAELESMAAQGCSFLVREFNPKVDRFEVACWRESNYPTLLDVEAGGKPMDARCRYRSVEGERRHAAVCQLRQRFLRSLL
jgi:hypothetical protein